MTVQDTNEKLDELEENYPNFIRINIPTDILRILETEAIEKKSPVRFKGGTICIGRFPLALADRKNEQAKELRDELIANAEASGSTLTKAELINQLELWH